MKTLAEQVKRQLQDGGEGEDELKKVTPRRIGSVVRRDLGLAGQVYEVPGKNTHALRFDLEEMEYLAARYGLPGPPVKSTMSTTSTDR